MDAVTTENASTSARRSASPAADRARHLPSQAADTRTDDPSAAHQGAPTATRTAPTAVSSSSRRQPETIPDPPAPVALDEILKDAVIVISGIENPDRRRLRDQALAMGAQYRPNWCPEATHLICPFSNTPKYREVKRTF